jgi:hypothetical protein
MVTGRPHSAERSRVGRRHGPVHGGQCAADSRGRGIPRSLTGYCVHVELATAFGADPLDAGDVVAIVSKLQLRRGCVSPRDLLYALEKLRITAQRACDRAKATDVLRMIPAGVVAAAVGV